MRKIPSYRLHRASGQAIVTLNSQDFYLGPFGSKESHAKYDRLIAEWMANHRCLAQPQSKQQRTIADLLVAYLEFAQGYYTLDGKPTSEYVAMVHVARPLRDLYEALPVDEFGPIALKAVRQKLIDRGLARRHINQQINRIRRIFKWGVENELVNPSVLHGLTAVAPLKRGRTPARETDAVKPVPDEHVEATLPHVSRQVAAMIQLQRFAGMRPGEVVLLRPCDVDRSGPIWVYKPLRHKTQYRSQEREVFFGPRAQEVLRPWLLRDSQAFCFSPKEAEAERNATRRQQRQSPMTPSHAKRRPKDAPEKEKRDRYDRDSYRRAVEYGIRKAKVPHWHPHQLRHNCGTQIRQEFGLDAAQAILGHRNAAVTEIYAEVNRQKAASIMGQVG
jgi:integrase